MCYPDNNNNNNKNRQATASAFGNQSVMTNPQQQYAGQPSSQLDGAANNSTIVGDDDEKMIHDRSSSSSSSSSSSLWMVQWLGQIVVGILMGAGTTWFSSVFPFWLTPEAARAVYQPAYWNYIAELSPFDNSAWTYVTDYIVAIIMIGLALEILSHDTHNNHHHHSKKSGGATASDDVPHRLKYYTSGLLLCYAVSVIAGGISHQTMVSLEMRQTWTFRILWTICVGTVTLASGFMGGAGSELGRYYFGGGGGEGRRHLGTPTTTSSTTSLADATADSKKEQQQQQQQQPPPWYTTAPSWIQSMLLTPPMVWISFGSTITGVCMAGYMSYQRPACDIFIAGITQFPPTFYIMAMIFLSDHVVTTTAQDTNTSSSLAPTTLGYRLLGLFGFIMNAPLLPMYALLLHYTDWSLASINTLLHTWLLTTWGMQGLCLRHFMKQMMKMRMMDAEKDEKKKTKENSTTTTTSNKNKVA